MTATARCLGRFVWHDLMTKDVSAAVKFYTVLFPEWAIHDLDATFGMPYRIIVAAGEEIGGIAPQDPSVDAPCFWLGSVAVEDCDATVTRFEQGGGKCWVPAQEIPGVGRYAVVADAQGAVLKPIQLTYPRTPPRRPAAGQFCWDTLMTSDLEAARQTYAGAFGWQAAELSLGGTGGYTTFRIGEEDVAAGLALPPGSDSRPGWLAYLRAENVETRTNKAAKLGATILVKPQDLPGIGRFSILADPMAAVFALFQPAGA